MLLRTAWENFTRAHNLEVVCLLKFLYKGGGELRLKVFDNISCRNH
jgi:hypothetical protein